MRVKNLLGMLVVSIMLSVPAALADSPNFHYANSFINLDPTNAKIGALGVDFKETGLGKTVSTEQVTLTVDKAEAEYLCINGGDNHPQAANKETVSTSLTTSGTFPVRNGQTESGAAEAPRRRAVHL